MVLNIEGVNMQWSQETARILTTAKWIPTRDRLGMIANWLDRLDNAFPIVEGAMEKLELFGGLHVEISGPGEGWSRQSFKIDPTLALGEDDRFADFSQMLGVRLFPLGEVGHEAFLALAENGKVYALMLDLWLVGDSMEEAIEALVRGKKARLIISETAYRTWTDGELPSLSK